MGIPYYFYVITQNHTGILLKECPVAPSHFYLDFNGGVHPVCQRLMKTMVEAPIDFEERLCDESWKYMMGLTQVVKPGAVHIMLDGIAPIAKIQQQRKRRYLSILRQTLMKTKTVWDTNAISPGTAFMSRLNAVFRENIQRTFSAIPFHFHGSDEVGEGEHKIFEKIQHTVTDAPQVIYGLDADLIMLSLLSHRPKLYLMREYQDRTKKGLSPQEEFHYLDIDALRGGILKTLKKDYHWDIPETVLTDLYSAEASGFIENYVVCCFLLGNDFIPNIACLHLKKNGLYSVLSTFREAYERVGHMLIGDGDTPFSAEFLNQWFECLSRQEDTWMREMNEAYFRKRPILQSEEDRVEFYPILPEHKAPLAFELHKMGDATQKWRLMYYRHLFDCERQNPTPRIQACREYLKGMLWTFAYYKRQPKPFDWYYPYGYAPTLLDIYYQLNGDIHLLDTEWVQWRSLENWATFVSPSVQLLSILPKESHHLLPEALRRPIGCIGYLYPTQYPLETYLKTHLWECHPKLPILDFDRLKVFCEAHGKPN